MNEDLKPELGLGKQFFIFLFILTLFICSLHQEGTRARGDATPSIAGIGSGEEDEIDDFVIMPNYRWENITTTSGVAEGLIGDIYYINSSANADFTKAR